MNSVSVMQAAAMAPYGPPGLTHPLLIEKYAWVDQRLREKYYNYALTSKNVDEYQYADLLTENYAWVDRRLADMCAFNEDDHLPPALAPSTWANYRENAVLECLEDPNKKIVGIKRKRYESDISEYEVEADRVVKRLRCQSPIPKGKLSLEIPHIVSEDENENEEDCYSDIVSVDLSDITYDEGSAQISDYEFDDEIISGTGCESVYPEFAFNLLNPGYSYDDESIPYDIDDRSF
jgi:hypothetical protein